MHRLILYALYFIGEAFTKIILRLFTTMGNCGKGEILAAHCTSMAG